MSLNTINGVAISWSFVQPLQPKRIHPIPIMDYNFGMHIVLVWMSCSTAASVGSFHMGGGGKLGATKRLKKHSTRRKESVRGFDEESETADWMQTPLGHHPFAFYLFIRKESDCMRARKIPQENEWVVSLQGQAFGRFIPGRV